MDIVTQGLTGSILALSLAEKKHLKSASIIGFVSGLTADLDFFIQSSEDPLLNLDFHRHFTHSLIFIPAGALFAALILWPFFRKKMPFRNLYVFSFAGYMLSGFIDACTSYGTHLLWPFSEVRTAFHIISIVDPIFSGILFSGIVFGIYKKNNLHARISVLLGALYFLFAFYQQSSAESSAVKLAEARNHIVERIVVKPSLGNVFLWRSTYISRGKIYVDAVRTIPGSVRIYEGSSVNIYRPERDALQLQNSVLYRDIIRFQTFSDGFIGLHPDEPDILGDVRYSMFPDSTVPLWGITLNAQKKDRHAELRYFRKMKSEDRQHFLDMFLGK